MTDNICGICSWPIHRQADGTWDHDDGWSEHRSRPTWLSHPARRAAARARWITRCGGDPGHDRGHPGELVTGRQGDLAGAIAWRRRQPNEKRDFILTGDVQTGPWRLLSARSRLPDEAGRLVRASLAWAR